MPLARELPDFTTIARSALFVIISGSSAMSLGRHNAAVIAQSQSPVVLQNCGVTITFARPPARVVTLNQAGD